MHSADSLPAVIVLAGPTASGKSALAMELARRHKAEIVNCDSLQLYRGFNIGTAKPSPAELAEIPHHLFDVLKPDTVFSAGDYGRLGRGKLQEIAARGNLPLVVGGTGFYLTALFDGLPALPSRDDHLRARLQAREARRPGSLYRLLGRLEPQAANRIQASDLQKQIRALEIRLLTGSHLPSREASVPLTGYRVLWIALNPPREQLARRIQQRTQAMFDAGLIEEVRGLLDAGLTGREKPFEAIGYKQAVRYLAGQISLEAARESVEIETRQYAKRQRTWFRRDSRFQWIEGFGDAPDVIERMAGLVARHLEAKPRTD